MQNRRNPGIVLAACALLLAACGGGGSIGNGSETGGGGTGTGSGTGTDVTTPVSVDSLRIVSSGTALPSDADTQLEGISFAAIVTDDNGNAVAGATVVFKAVTGSTPSGALIVTRAVSDATGTATAVLTTGGDSSLRTIQVSAKVGTLSSTPGSIAVQVVAPTSPAVPAPGLGNGNGNAYEDQIIAAPQATIAAGGSTGLHLNLVDRNNGNALLSSQTPSISFNSACIAAGRSTLTPASGTINGGSFDATYKANGCSGVDVVTATAVLAGGSTLTAKTTLTVEPATLGTIKFVSATPNVIGLRSSGQGETSVVVFEVLDSSGGAAINKCVFFDLSTMAGGLSLSSPSAKSDGLGRVQTTVKSGTVHTAVRVTATAFTEVDASPNSCARPASGASISSQSEQLAVSTAIPDQNSFSLSLGKLNITGANHDGVTTTVNARLSDRFNNPVPDGTAVAFFTEGGSIQPQCTTVGGACSVIFTSQQPRVSNHRYTIMATAIGEESFSDLNGNGLYDLNEPFRIFDEQNPLIVPDDLGEAFIDKDENGKRDETIDVLTNEEFSDFNNDGVYQAIGDGSFTGTLCSSGCSDSPAPPSPPLLNVRRSIVLVMSSDTAIITITPPDGIACLPQSTPGNCLFQLPPKATATFSVLVQDTAGQSVAAGATVKATTTYGTVNEPLSFTQADSNQSGGTNYLFSLKGPDTAESGGLLRIEVNVGGLVSSASAALTP